MPGLVFVNILRMVSPGSPLERKALTFYTLGSFDVIRIEGDNFASLKALHAKNKQLHLDIPVHFDRQPLYLYAADGGAQEGIFSIHAENAIKPLVLTLIQLDDFRLKLYTPEDVIAYFEDYVGKMIVADKELSRIEYRAFYSLGESNVVLALRGESIEGIGRLLFRMRLLEDDDKGVYVLSMCSHCAFPGADDDDMLQRNFETWLKRDTDVHFFTITDTSYGLNNNWNKIESKFIRSHYLLGEWDYCQNWYEDSAEKNASNYVRNVLRMLHDPGIPRFPQNLRTAYTIPMIPLHGDDKLYAESRQTLSDIQTDDHNLLIQYEGRRDEKVSQFEKLADSVQELTDMYSEAFCKELSERILSMRQTLTGIVKHLLNLKDGRFQQDLFAFLRPVFCTLPLITKDICQLVSDYHTPQIQEKASVFKVADLLDMFIQDTSRLLSELQHLLSVLSVSPHTFLETYGSNMRSIAATCKLLAAYQGIVYNISSHFDMTLRSPSGRKKVNEVMLVLPYRNIRQMTRVLYEKASPYNRIAYIRINSSDMLDIPKTLFLLLHECGHNVLPHDFRMDRMRCYFQAVLGFLVDRSCSDFYLRAFWAMETPLFSSKEKRKPTVSRITIRNEKKEDITDKQQDAINSEIKTGFQEICAREADRMCGQWENYLKNIKKKRVPLLDVYRCRFFVAVMPYARRYIEELLGYSPIQIHGNSIGQFFDDLLGTCVFEKYRKILKAELNKRGFNDDPELYDLIRLYTEYDRFPKAALQNPTAEAARMIGRVYQDACNEIRIIFSDIYSDVFAFYMLRLDRLNSNEKRNEAEKYIEIAADHAGFQTNSEFVKTSVLVRMLIVLVWCYGVSPDDVIDFLVSRLPLSAEIKKNIKNDCETAVSSIYYTFVEDYARKLCRQSILKQRETHQELDKDTIRLYTMYASASDPNRLGETIGNIHHFWMCSTQRKGGE